MPVHGPHDAHLTQLLVSRVTSLGKAMALIVLTITPVDVGRFSVRADYGHKGNTEIMCVNLHDMLNTIRIFADGDWSRKPDGRE